LERFIDSSRLKIKGRLDRGAVDSLNPPQRGLGVTGKSSTPREKFLVSSSIISLLNFISAIYFELFTFLEIELLLVTLGCKLSLVIGLVRYWSFLVSLIKFSSVCDFC